jgi:hypothetical protein
VDSTGHRAGPARAGPGDVPVNHSHPGEITRKRRGHSRYGPALRKHQQARQGRQARSTRLQRQCPRGPEDAGDGTAALTQAVT